MAGSAWLALRQAQEAVANRRPEEAHRLIEPLVAEGYRRAWRLAREVVRAYVARATQALDHDNPDAAWRDLFAAEALNTGEKAVAELRQTLSRLGMAQAKAALEAGNPLDALAAVGKLQDRGVRHPDLARLTEVSQDWGLAVELADRGEFLRALDVVEKVRPKLPCPAAGLDRFRAEVDARHARFRSAVSRLYEAAEDRRWRDALLAADAVLAVAPGHQEARAVRGKAWLAAEPGSDYGGPRPEGVRERDGLMAAPTRPHRAPAEPPGSATLPYASPAVPPAAGNSHAPPSLPKRFLLWVDGVGGYLVCLTNRVTFGQATGDGPVDVPLYADVSRLHAELARDGEGYVLSSAKAVLVNGKESTRSVLAPSDRITLGASCQFLFHRPVSVSSTARLELTSGHRLPVAVDAVILMANELILGGGPDAHVVVPGVTAPVLIYRSKDGLGVRVPGPQFRVDDRVCSDRAALPLPAVVTSDAVTFAVEPVAARL
jgi:hypothetical protein